MGNFFTRKALKIYGGKPRIEVTPLGRWEETIRTIGALSKTIKSSSHKAQLKVGTEIVKRVKGHIRKQDLGWEELGEVYSRKKRAAGLNGGTLIAYGKYYDSIKVWQKGDQHMVYAGVRKGIYTRSLTGKKTKLDVATIAAMHEFSKGKRFPRRPLWNPTLEEMGGKEGIKTMYINSLIWWLRFNKVPIETQRTIKSML